MPLVENIVALGKLFGKEELNQGFVMKMFSRRS
jgi:hypothetical protein